jgi:selenocysteine lyase/cysteine desulfurase
MPSTQRTDHEGWPGIRGYLDTAAYGLPPTAATHAMRGWVDQWAEGSAPFADWLSATDQARGLFASLIGGDGGEVATGTSVSQLTGLIAGSLPDGSRVLAPEGEFASLLFPFLAQADRRITVREVPRDRLLDAIGSDTDVVACSAVSSSDGQVAPLRELADVARAAGARTVVDAAQACGWLDADWWRFDAVITSAFKWLSCPRGVAFMALSQELLNDVRPTAAGWFASDERQQYSGGPLRLAGDARRLDISPVWSSWTAARESLNVLLTVGVPAIEHHDLRLANRLRAGLGHPTQRSPIVIVDGEEVAAALHRAAIVCSPRPAGARLSFHLYNNEDDVDRALDALADLELREQS